MKFKYIFFILLFVNLIINASAFIAPLHTATEEESSPYYSWVAEDGYIYKYFNNGTLAIAYDTNLIDDIAVVQYYTYDNPSYLGGGGGGDAEEIHQQADQASHNVGGGGYIPEVVQGLPSYCGDLICQPEGNSKGVKEDFFNCPNDCQSILSLWSSAWENHSILFIIMGVFLFIISYNIIKSLFWNDKAKEIKKEEKDGVIKYTKVDNRSYNNKLKDGI